MKIKKKLTLLLIFFIIIGSAIICRLSFLQLINHQFYIKKSQSQLNKVISLSAQRGHILDTNKRPLAYMKKSYSLYTFPQKIKDKEKYSEKLAAILNISKIKINQKINSKKGFVWIKKHCSEKTIQAIKKQKIEPIYYIKEKKRVYPEDNLACHVLGFVGIDNQGLSGLEYKFDKILKGQKGTILLAKDPHGNRLISSKKKISPPYNGQHIVTTIDSYIQHITEKHLQWGIESFQAKQGQVIVLDPKSGDILAMANYPNFNPNNWKKNSNEERKNTNILNIFEPGSILKTITLAAAIDQNIITSQSILEVPPTITIGKHTINEAHPPEPDTPLYQSVSDILTYSSNVGTTKIALKLGKKQLYSYLNKFGFGQKTKIELPGEQKGLMKPVSKWSKLDTAMISFGQSIACTGLQLCSAIGAIANQGLYIKPRIIKYFTSQDFSTRHAIPIQPQQRIIKKKTAKEITEIMIKVVEEGTATPAKIKGYQIAGKTSTAQKASPTQKGYLENNYTASFSGFFPAQNPQIVILVTLDEPKPVIWGGYTSGKIFRKIAWDIINYLKIPPNID